MSMDAKMRRFRDKSVADRIPTRGSRNFGGSKLAYLGIQSVSNRLAHPIENVISATNRSC